MTSSELYHRFLHSTLSWVLLGYLIDTPGLKARGFHSSVFVSRQSELHFCIRGAPARGDPAGPAPHPHPPAPLYTRLPNPSMPQLRAVKARVRQDVQVHRRSAGADAGRKRERVDDDEPVYSHHVLTGTGTAGGWGQGQVCLFPTLHRQQELRELSPRVARYPSSPFVPRR